MRPPTRAVGGAGRDDPTVVHKAGPVEVGQAARRAEPGRSMGGGRGRELLLGKGGLHLEM